MPGLFVLLAVGAVVGWGAWYATHSNRKGMIVTLDNYKNLSVGDTLGLKDAPTSGGATTQIQIIGSKNGEPIASITGGPDKGKGPIVVSDFIKAASIKYQVIVV